MKIRSSLFLFFLALSAPCFTQPTLDFKRIDVAYPTIKLVFKVSCNGVFRNDIEPQRLEVRENGILVKTATLWCPPFPDCCVSAALVLDRTGSMSEPKEDPKINRLKTGAKAYVAQMNPDGRPCDETALVTFSTIVYRDMQMTTNKPLLNSLIDGMVATGSTPLWDAVAVGIDEIVANAKNPCKAVIVLTDGGDNNSQVYRSVQQVITYALEKRVKVFTIGYGVYPGSRQESDLQLLATYTGGSYYGTENGADLVQIFASMKRSIKESYQECVLSYETNCPDGSERIVELTVKNFCNGSDSKTKTYTAPRDQSKFKTVYLSLGNAIVTATKEVLVPVRLETPLTGVFSKSNFTVVYDRSAATLVRVETAGGLLSNVPITLQDIGSGHTIYLQSHTEFFGEQGTLLWLVFRAGDVVSEMNLNLWLYNWHFDAYCLIPQLRNGALKITPRVPVLECRADAPANLVWDDFQKSYIPNPFTASVAVTNTGTREALNVRVRITITQPGLELVTPIVFDQVIPGVINPNETKTVSWDVRALKQENNSTMRVCFDVVAENHPAIQCCRDIEIGVAQAPALVCAISAPDTIFFREQFYEPEEFDIHVHAINAGSGLARAVKAQLLQDTRFTITSQSALTLADMLAPNDSASGTFRVRMHPRQTDGFDTIRVNIQGEDTNPAWCEYPIWVQRVRAPQFQLTCTTPNPTLIFDELSGDYLPNPIPITTTAKNVGETYAEECQLLFVGPPRFTPIGTNLRPLGTMNVNDTRSASWMVRALPRSIGGWDTLHFQVLGKGGLGRPIVIADCFLPIYVPETRAPRYEVTCTAPDSLVYKNNAYSPNPFPYTITIRNTGTAVGRNLSTAIILPAGLVLDAGEPITRGINELRPGDSAQVSWRVSPVIRDNSASLNLCARMLDGAGNSVECCREVFVPREEPPALHLSCTTIDTLFIDPQTGRYLGNPFRVTLQISNNGRGTAENVQASISLLGPYVQVGSAANLTIGDIGPGKTETVTWDVHSLNRSEAIDLPIKMRVKADNHPEVLCERSVHLPALKWPVLSPACSSIPEDTLHFDWDIGDFERKEFSVRTTIRNTGAVQATNVSALLIIPVGVVLGKDELTQKPTSPSTIEPGGEASVEWRLKPVRERDGALRQFRVVVQSDNADEARCEDALFIQGSPKSMTLSLPDNLLFRYGQKGFVPVQIDKTVGKDLATYTFELEYDPSVITIHYVTNSGTLTHIGWVGASMTHVASDRVRISDYTTTSPLRTSEGTLVMLFVEGVYRSPADVVGFSRSDLHFTESSVLFNQGEIAVETTDGMIYVTNDCLEPLQSNGTQVLEQNRPNPFNPSTVIRFWIPSDDRTRIVVTDPMGRQTYELIDEQRGAGWHEVTFDASSLPTGLYFYRLETSLGITMRKMILTR